MVVSAPSYLSGGENASTIFNRLAFKMRQAGYPLNGRDSESMLAQSFAEVLYDVGVVQAAALADSIFLVNASVSDLDRHGVHYAGGTRLAATKALADVTFEGVDGTVIPIGTRISTGGQAGVPATVFETLAAAEIGTPDTGTVTVQAQAVDAGSRGNVGAASIRFLSNPIAGVDVSNVFNTLEAAGGSDTETDDDYRTRLIILAAREPGMANIAAYEAILDTLPGVGFRLVEPHWNGLGTIRVVILDDTGDIPSTELVDLVQAALDPLAYPGEGQGAGSISHVITVVAPTELDLTLNVPALVPEAGVTLSQAKAALEVAANAYLDTVNPGGALIIRDLEAVIIQAEGVANIGDITIDSGAGAVRADVPLLTTQKAVLDTVTYS